MLGSASGFRSHTSSGQPQASGLIHHHVASGFRSHTSSCSLRLQVSYIIRSASGFRSHTSSGQPQASGLIHHQVSLRLQVSYIIRSASGFRSHTSSCSLRLQVSYIIRSASGFRSRMLFLVEIIYTHDPCRYIVWNCAVHQSKGSMYKSLVVHVYGDFHQVECYISHVYRLVHVL